MILERQPSKEFVKVDEVAALTRVPLHGGRCVYNRQLDFHRRGLDGAVGAGEKQEASIERNHRDRQRSSRVSGCDRARGCRGQAACLASRGLAVPLRAVRQQALLRRQPSRTGFTDSSAPPASAEMVAEAGPLRMTLRPNGPLQLDGPCEVRHPASGLIFAGRQTALCRCGQSKTKPFCDGTHRNVGFAAT